jgi:hypothetical protein
MKGRRVCVCGVGLPLFGAVFSARERDHLDQVKKVEVVA